MFLFKLGKLIDDDQLMGDLVQSEAFMITVEIIVDIHDRCVRFPGQFFE